MTGIGAVLHGFVEEQLAPWAGRRWNGTGFADMQSLAASRSQWVVLFLLHGSTVHVLPKPALDASTAAPVQFRAELYRRLLQEALALRPAPAPVVMAVDVGDGASNSCDVPVFTFQKRRGEAAPLLPDTEMIDFDFYEKVEEDTVPFEEKQDRAVFSGSTTGGGLISLSAAQEARFPRLRAAEFFRGQDSVDFRLTRLVQCEGPEVEEYLIGRGHGGCPSRWQDTYRAKFGISMDGNGAACSRPVILLRSNGVLLRYASDHVLYFDSALIPGTHYLEIDRDQEVLDIVAAERRQPGRYAAVAANGRSFARNVLSRQAVLAYTSALISAYAAIIP